MNSFSVQEARELTVFAEQARERLVVATASLSETQSGQDAQAAEHSWLAVASQRVHSALEQTLAALSNAAPLPEFASTRKTKVETLSNAWADAIESVFDGIIANVSGNGPLVEALFPHQRFAALRRPGTAAHNYWLEFERRAESSYVRRLRSDPAYDFLTPLLEAARASERELRQSVAPRALPEAEAEKLRTAVSNAAEELELALRQARSLSEAAFARTPALFSELGLEARPKRRVHRAETAKAANS